MCGMCGEPVSVRVVREAEACKACSPPAEGDELDDEDEEDAQEADRKGVGLQGGVLVEGSRIGLVRRRKCGPMRSRASAARPCGTGQRPRMSPPIIRHGKGVLSTVYADPSQDILSRADAGPQRDPAREGSVLSLTTIWHKTGRIGIGGFTPEENGGNWVL